MRPSSPFVSPALLCLSLLSSLLGSACDSPRVVHITSLSYGDPCANGGLCKEPLVCGAASGVCEPPGNLSEGQACVVSADCLPDLYCARGVCALAGDGVLGDVCADTGDCASLLRCTFSGYGGTCINDGASYLDGACLSSDDCLAGLICDGSGHCAVAWEEPFGRTCESDDDCKLDVDDTTTHGLVCTPAGVCEGRGPDGQAIPDWGVTCNDGTTLEGDFRLFFDVLTTDFFRLPYPNDARRTASGRRLDGYPTPGQLYAPSDLVSEYVRASGGLVGFGPNETVVMRFSGPPLFCPSCSAGDATCFATCMGEGGTMPMVYVVDITRTNGAFPASPFNPVRFSWSATTASSEYVCGPSLSLWPAATHPWRAGHTYLVFVHKSLNGVRYNGDQAEHVPIVQDGDFAAMLAATPPGDATRLAAWNAYEPLRAFVASSPVYPTGHPNAGTVMTAADIAGGTLFTIRDPAAPLLALAQAVDAAALPTLHDLHLCDGPSDAPPCPDPATGPYRELRGFMRLPRFQSGEPPYTEVGGAIAFDAAGNAVMQGEEDVPFTLTLPAGAPPANGWPLVLFAHGTGGDHRTHIDNGLAVALSEIDVSGTKVHFAVLGFDQVANGARRYDAILPEELLFFNLLNPEATRGNVLQGAADILAVMRAVDALSTEAAARIGSAGRALDTGLLGFIGHSQGARTGALAMAVSSGPAAVVLAGADAHYATILTSKTARYDFTRILPLMLAVDDLDARRTPPVSLMQGYLEEADPAFLAPSITAPVLGRGTAKSVLQILGTTDGYAPTGAAMTLARRLGNQFLDPGQSGLIDSNYGDQPATTPVHANKAGLTRVTSIIVPAAGAEPHRVFTEDAAALEQIRQFLATAQLDADHVPTVP